MTIEQSLQLAIAHHQAGRLAAAEPIYRQILAVQPEHADALHLLGLIAAATGHFDGALELIGKAIEIAPREAVYHSNLGEAYRQLNRSDEAVATLRHALELQPDFPDALAHLGSALIAVGRFDEAIANLRRALAIEPARAETHHALGFALSQNERRDEAVACYRRAVELRPDFAEPLANLGSALIELGAPEEAIVCLRRALTLQPDNPAAHNNLGNALAEIGAWDEAIACYERALALKPDCAEVVVNLGVAWQGTGEFERALACNRELVRRCPDLPAAHWNLALTLLLLGHYEEGWREHEWRLAITRPQRTFAAPQWDGTPAPGRTILLHAEQGFGDTMQFVRYAPLVRARAGAARVILECQPSLVRLLKQSGGWDAEVVAEGTAPACDLHMPLPGLPLALRMFEPWHPPAPYLRADPELRAHWRERLRGDFRVGLAWAGSRAHKDDRRRSIPFEKLSPLLRVPGVSFYSVQLEPRAPNDAGVIDLTAHITDFADTAALMAELDLVITVDTAAAHLAGALGRPVWTLLAFVPEWRWGLDREDTPWYPTMRLFRQRTMGDWDSVVRRVADELSTMR